MFQNSERYSRALLNCMKWLLYLESRFNPLSYHCGIYAWLYPMRSSTISPNLKPQGLQGNKSELQYLRGDSSYVLYENDRVLIYFVSLRCRFVFGL